MSNLTQSEIQAMISGFQESKVINLDAPIRQLVDTVTKNVRRNPGDEVSGNVFAYSGYVFVTPDQVRRLDEISSIASSLKSAASQISTVSR